ncbi:hypothetical protein Aple_095430 [Acrocarpospora pleiomorpha]|uniref:non-specific serine/threonine protein kinase n=1 Tax=Acrocarpospora pleiomorpha TaxID=90975 RepID=A0A5M3XZW4_9ACTN|nr:hypothetical protein Aple_095430 [Acrocarpospora pleiomorpha]
MNVGTVIDDRYRVIRSLGEGACGAVVVAQDLAEGREVAVKIQPERSFEESDVFAEGREEFVREACNLEKLSGIRGIPECHGTGLYRGRRYVVMDLVTGMTLEKFAVNPGAHMTAVAASVLGQLCEILWEVHSRQMVHRDIKPANIMVELNGEIRLLDLGFALECGVVPAWPSGTLGYSAPEQYLPGNRATVACEIFSLGCVLFEMIAHTLPYDGNARGATRASQAFAPGRLSALDPTLRDLGLAMVAVDPADRPADVIEVLRYLKPVLPLPGSARHAKLRPPDVTTWYRKRRGIPLP